MATAMSEAQSSPGPPGDFKTVQEELAYYKNQYEQLEADLQDFQSSSKEIEAELEKDIEASEKRERGLKEKTETLRYEVDEWKTKYRQAKTEASNAQNSLQKEITGLRESNRTLQLKLRDIEVANDDFERQARNTTSSLEDLESKYNVSLERGVMLEEEIKAGEQEREQLRIQAQRLREELSDLKVEAEITMEKLRVAEGGAARLKRASHLSDARDSMLRSPTSDAPSIPSSFAAPTAPSENSATNSIATTPPSPPLSDISAAQRKDIDPQAEPHRLDAPLRDPNATPRPSSFNSRSHAPRHSRGPSTAAGTLPSYGRGSLATPRPRPSAITAATEPPRSTSLYQIRGLIGKMQKLEARVQSARSKLPAPTGTPPRSSPRVRSQASEYAIPNTALSNVTVRSARKRSVADTTESSTPSRLPETSSRRQSRASLGGGGGESALPRPSSRMSNTSYGGTTGQFVRPASRAAQERYEPYRRPASAAEAQRRPQSALSGVYAPPSSTTMLPGARNRGSGFHAASVSSGIPSIQKGQEDPPEARNRYGTPLVRRKESSRSPGVTGLPQPGTLARRQSASVLNRGAGQGAVGGGTGTAAGGGGTIRTLTTQHSRQFGRSVNAAVRPAASTSNLAAKAGMPASKPAQNEDLGETY